MMIKKQRKTGKGSHSNIDNNNNDHNSNNAINNNEDLDNNKLKQETIRLKVTNACKNCQTRKVKCSGEKVCQRCNRLKLNCEFLPPQKKRGPPKGRPLIHKRKAKKPKIVVYKKLNFRVDSTDRSLDDSSNANKHISESLNMNMNLSNDSVTNDLVIMSKKIFFTNTNGGNRNNIDSNIDVNDNNNNDLFFENNALISSLTIKSSTITSSPSSSSSPLPPLPLPPSLFPAMPLSKSMLTNTSFITSSSPSPSSSSSTSPILMSAASVPMNTATFYLNTRYQNLPILEEGSVMGLGNQFCFFPSNYYDGNNNNYAFTTFQLYDNYQNKVSTIENRVTGIDFSNFDNYNDDNNMPLGDSFDYRNDTDDTYGVINQIGHHCDLLPISQPSSNMSSDIIGDTEKMNFGGGLSSNEDICELE